MEIYSHCRKISIFIEINISSVEFNLINDSNSCKAYLEINDFIEPPNVGVYRIANSSYLNFMSTNLSNIASFEIDDSRLNVTDNSTNTDINIYYTFAYNNFTTVKSRNIRLGKILIYKYFNSLIIL
jgi:hypothetical protein